MDQEVAKTLGELELKLQQLEHELTSIGPHDAPADRPQEPDSGHSGPDAPLGGPGAAPGAGSSQVQSSGRLVNEAMEPSQAAEAIAEGDGFDGPPVFGGEEVPAQPAATGQDWKVDVRETAYGEIPSESPTGPPLPGHLPPPATPPGPPPPEHPPTPTPRPDPQPIDRAELVRFKQRLERTMAELSEELGRLLLPKPPT